MTSPADLNISGKQDPSNKDYFDITINPLKLVTTYGFQFQWIFEDKELNKKVGDNWSNVFPVTTISDSINKPQFRSADLSYTGNTLIVSWTGKDYLGADYKGNIQRVDIWAKGGSFGSDYKVVGSFQKAGSQTITAAAAQYYVKLQAVSNSGGVSLFSDEQTIITESPLIVDLTPPANPTAPGVVAGVDPKDQTGFSAYATFSWTHHPNADTNGTRGYRIRWTYDTTNPIYEYGFVDYPNNSYTATGLIPNVEYTFQVASVDQFNNTQTYLPGGTFTATDPTISDGWARLKSYISIGGATGDLFKFGTGINTSINTSLTTTPSLSTNTYNGIILNKTGNNNNYWLTTGQFRVGGNTQFMYWDGTNLSITGDLGVGGGATIAGNLFMKTTGASIYSGSIVNDTLPDGTRGFVLNNNGLLVQDNGTGSNRKYVRLDPTTGTLFANNAQITGEVVITSGATKTAIDDAASKAQTATNNVTTLTGQVAQKARVFRDASYSTSNRPTPSAIGDIWIDVNDNNKMYVASTTASTGWILSQDSSSKLDSATFSKSEIIGKLNAGIVGASGTTISGSVIATGAIISNNVSAGERGIRGDTFTSAGSIFDLDNGTISTPNFKINSAGNAEFKGSIKSGSTVTGAQITGGSLAITGTDIFGATQTVSVADGLISISSTGTSFLSGGAMTISGKNLSNQNVSSNVGAAYFSLTDPSNTGIITMSGTGTMQIYTGGGNSGQVILGGPDNNTNLSIQGKLTVGGGLNTSGGTAVVVGSSVGTPVVRNIGAGTGPKSSSATDGIQGDIWIQYT